MYIRHYGLGLGLGWDAVFQTEDRCEVEERCAQASMQFEWKPGGVLKTACVRAGVAAHPITGEMVWLNQAQHWHPFCLDAETRDSLFSLFAEEDLPRNCCFGDGSRIEDTVMQEICDVYRQLEVAFPWQTGDVMLLDNLLTAHARNPFDGTRTLLVAMG